MSKTQETIGLEDALDLNSRKKREYGCREVTIGFKSEGHGNEIVDYMSMDAKEVFRCYELKVSVSDLKTDNALSFYGDYNYLVVSPSLYLASPEWDNWIPPYCGILVGEQLTVKRQARKKRVPDQNRAMLKDSLLRSVYWKMVEYQDAALLSSSRKIQKELEEEKESVRLQLQQSERQVWTGQDYEHYYRLNHQDPSFTLEKAAKEERRQYSLRKKHDLIHDGKCPCCGHEIQPSEKWCPTCGMDLRGINE